MAARRIPVAVASGVSADNAAELVPSGASALLVATSVESEFATFSQRRLERLIAIVRELD